MSIQVIMEPSGILYFVKLQTQTSDLVLAMDSECIFSKSNYGKRLTI